MTQKQRLIDAMCADNIEEVELILGEAQNRPPLGEADGSISEPLWTAFRDWLQARRSLDLALKQVLEALKE